MTAGAPPSACMCVWRGARNQHARGTRHAARKERVVGKTWRRASVTLTQPSA
jgi:hypothetical protein